MSFLWRTRGRHVAHLVQVERQRPGQRGFKVRLRRFEVVQLGFEVLQRLLEN